MVNISKNLKKSGMERGWEKRQGDKAGSKRQGEEGGRRGREKRQGGISVQAQPASPGHVAPEAKISDRDGAGRIKTNRP